MARNANDANTCKRWIKGYRIMSEKSNAVWPLTFLSYSTFTKEYADCMTTIPSEVQMIEVFHFFTSSSPPALRSIRNTEITRYTTASNIMTFLRSFAIRIMRYFAHFSPVKFGVKYSNVFQNPKPESDSTL